MSNYNSPKFKNPKTAFYILLTYIFVFQLSGFIFQFPAIREFALSLIDAPADEKVTILVSWWSFIVGILSFIIIGVLVMRNKSFFHIYPGEKATIPQSIGWGVIGFFLVFFGQTIAALIEVMIGIPPGSENTASLVEIAKIAPIMIVLIAVMGPILEELVFRRVIFGSLVQVQGFWLSAIISGVIFAAIHLEFSHIILYTVCGIIFAFLYHKTKRLLTSIIAHILLNTFVVTINFNIEKIEQFQRFLESLIQQ